MFTAQKDFRLTDFTPTQCVLFADLERRPVVLAFDQAHGSSDGGAILLAAANRRFSDGLIESLSSCLQDARQQGKVDHPLTHLMRQRIYGLACGYEDANDAVNRVVRIDESYRPIEPNGSNYNAQKSKYALLYEGLKAYRDYEP